RSGERLRRPKIKGKTKSSVKGCGSVCPTRALSGGGVLQLRHFRARRRLLVAGDALVQSFRNLLTITRALQIAFVGGAADKGNLGKNRWHGSPSEDDECGILDSTITDVGATCGQGGIKRTLDACRQPARLLDLFVQATGR